MARRTTTGTLPWLASDFNRSMAATAISFLLYAVIFVLSRRGPLVSITAAWACWSCYCFLVSSAIPLAFRGLRGDDLRRALLQADDQHSPAIRRLMRRRRWRSVVMGGDAPAWSLGISLMNLLFVVVLMMCAALAGNVTFGTTDVAVISSRMRRTMTAHALVAFVFNTVLLAVLLSVLVG